MRWIVHISRIFPNCVLNCSNQSFDDTHLWKSFCLHIQFNLTNEIQITELIVLIVFICKQKLSNITDVQKA